MPKRITQIDLNHALAEQEAQSSVVRQDSTAIPEIQEQLTREEQEQNR